MWDSVYIYVTEQDPKSVSQIKFLSSKLCGLTTLCSLLYFLFKNYLIPFWLIWETPSPLPTQKQTVIFQFIVFTTNQRKALLTLMAFSL